MATTQYSTNTSLKLLSATGQFHPPGTGSQPAPGGAAVINDRLYYVGGDKHDNGLMRVHTCDLAAGDVTDESAWASYPLPPNSIGLRDPPATQRGSSAVTVGGKLYVFWADAGERDAVVMSSTDGVDLGGDDHKVMWTNACKVLATKTSNINTFLTPKIGGLSAFAYGNLIVIVTISDTYEIAVNTLDPAQVNAVHEGCWSPVHTTTISQSDLRLSTPPFQLDSSRLASEIAADWCTDGVDEYVVLATLNKKEHVVQLVTLTARSPGSGDFALLRQRLTTISSAHSGVEVRRDPAGRLRVFFADHSHNLCVATVRTDNIGSVSELELSDVTGRASLPTGDDLLLNNEERDTNNCVRAVYTTSVNDSKSSSNVVAADASEIVLYIDRSDDNPKIKCQMAPYGLIVTHNRAQVLEVADRDAPYSSVLSGMVMKFPIDKDTCKEEDKVYFDLAVDFTRTLTNQESVVEEKLFMAGMATEFAAPGAAGSTSLKFEAGPTNTASTTTYATVSSATMVSSSGSSTAVDQHFGAIKNPVAIVADDYYMLPPLARSTTAQSDSQRYLGGPATLTVAPQWDDGRGVELIEYLVDPGNLSSYTVESINQRMRDIFPTSTEFGRKYSSVIRSGYVDALLAKAVPLRGASESKKYLYFSYSGGTVTDETSDVGTTKFTETAYTVSETLEAALGVHADVSIGITSASSTISALVGSRFSVTTSETINTTVARSISVTPHAGNTGTAFGFSDYAVRLYLIEADPMWTEELIAAYNSPWFASERKDFVDAMISQTRKLDVGGGPWRILCIVD